jgi:hypothetical protein
LSKEKFPPMNNVEYRKMVIEMQTMVDDAKDRPKNKGIEKVGLCENDELR